VVPAIGVARNPQTLVLPCQGTSGELQQVFFCSRTSDLPKKYSCRNLLIAVEMQVGTIVGKNHVQVFISSFYCCYRRVFACGHQTSCTGFEPQNARRAPAQTRLLIGKFTPRHAVVRLHPTRDLRERAEHHVVGHRDMRQGRYASTIRPAGRSLAIRSEHCQVPPSSRWRFT
jgi:hypothetical protein